MSADPTTTRDPDPKTLRDTLTSLYQYQDEMQQAYKDSRHARYFELACAMAIFAGRSGLHLSEEIPSGYWIVEVPERGLWVYAESLEAFLVASPYASDVAACDAAWTHARKDPHFQEVPLPAQTSYLTATKTSTPTPLGLREEARLRLVYRRVFEKCHAELFPKITCAIGIVRTYAHYAGDERLKQSLALIQSEVYVAEEAQETMRHWLPPDEEPAKEQ